ncbi:hypothetical protein ACP70R_014567 [Stipagrostis hirtigluma subsp. patula]
MAPWAKEATTAMVLAVLLLTSSATVAMAREIQKQGPAATEGGSQGTTTDEDACMARRTLDTHTDDYYADPHCNNCP